MSDIFEALFSGHNDGQIMTCGLILPSDQNSDIILVSTSIAKQYEVEYILDNQKRPPLMRLYETVFPKHNIQKVVSAIKNISSLVAPIPMKWGEIEVDTHNIIIWGNLNEELRQFQRMIMQVLSPLREGYYKQKYSNREPFFSNEEKDSLLKWGSPWAENYLPHMVVAKSLTKFPVVKLLNLEWNYRRCVFPGIIIGEKNPQGGLKEFQIFPFNKII